VATPDWRELARELTRELRELPEEIVVALVNATNRVVPPVPATPPAPAAPDRFPPVEIPIPPEVRAGDMDVGPGFDMAGEWVPIEEGRYANMRYARGGVIPAAERGAAVQQNAAARTRRERYPLTRCCESCEAGMQMQYRHAYPDFAERMRAEDREREMRRTATKRAEVLLDRLLDDQQRRDLLRHRYFCVVGSLGGRYLIGDGAVILVDGPYHPAPCQFCVHPDGQLPAADVMLAHKLAIETDEQRFLHVANPFGGMVISPTFQEVADRYAPRQGASPSRLVKRRLP
jgi:hypothetical protein